MFKYIKNFFEPDDKQLRAEAFESAKRHFAGRPRWTVSVDDWQRYQTSYRIAYRHEYAKTESKGR